jgi:hypothetical protein
MVGEGMMVILEWYFCRKGGLKVMMPDVESKATMSMVLTMGWIEQLNK